MISRTDTESDRKADDEPKSGQTDQPVDAASA